MRFIVKRKDKLDDTIEKKVISILEKRGIEWTDKIDDDADFAVIIGGDGTLLRYNYMLKCPILGINPGHSVGYYMRATDLDFEENLTKLVDGKAGKDYFIYDLVRLEAFVNGKRMKGTALNEVLVSPIYVRRALKTTLEIDGSESKEISSGIIIYTPTGSTAFAHSAGAKSIGYDWKVMGVTSLAPHKGKLKGGEVIIEDGEVKVGCLSREGEVCIDGSEVELQEIKRGDVVTVRKCKCPVKLIGFKEKFSS